MKSEKYNESKDKKSVYKDIITIIITIIVLYLVFGIGFGVLVRQNSKNLYNIILKSDKDVLKTAVDNRLRKINSKRNLLKKQGKTKDEIYSEVYDSTYEKVHSLKYPGDGYMWVNEIKDYNGGDGYAVRLMHPNPASSEGLVLSTRTTDAAGNRPYQKELDIVKKSGSGFYMYYYKAYKNDKPVKKLTYCALDKEYNWVICVGMNLSSIRQYDALQRKAIKPYVDRTLIILVIVCMCLTIIIALYFSKQYNRKLLQKNKKLDDLAYKDPLTGIYNRGGLNRRLESLVNDEKVIELTGIFIDLDDFKLINDIYGHVAGDLALKNLSEFLRRSFPDALIGRTGGDEFCVIISNKSPEECGELFEKVIPGEKTFSYEDKSIRYTLSGGYASYPSQARDSAEFITMMDNALYAAKLGGKHTAKHYQDYMSNIRRDQLGFNVSNMAYGMPGAFLIYKADESEKILFANDHLIDLFECDNYDDFLDYTQSSFRRIVYNEDLDKVEKSINDQIEQGKINSPSSQNSYEDYVAYRIRTKTGNVINVIDFGRLVHDQHYGDVFYVFIVDVDKLKGRIIFPKSC
ncbi:MAG: diguanylate cyclase [Lachnospiraceae bacterium]|uniref:Diguanylate cyclase n=1 Tax=Candidatus Weimeria bifida TaxID=2599074 RepID=A0A6N7IYZ8_9FIRM|nr:diguanylate cyclase [Candidatus Weimeria bifida]RRF95464.1 MAG: diguanylate cyclase [Lachnospiraceae bacterium]